MAIKRYTARYLAQSGNGKDGVVLADDHDKQMRRLKKALNWAAQWAPTLRDVSPLPTKDIQKLVYGYTLPTPSELEKHE